MWKKNIIINGKSKGSYWNLKKPHWYKKTCWQDKIHDTVVWIRVWDPETFRCTVFQKLHTTSVFCFTVTSFDNRSKITNTIYQYRGLWSLSLERWLNYLFEILQKYTIFWLTFGRTDAGQRRPWWETVVCSGAGWTFKMNSHVLQNMSYSQ